MRTIPILSNLILATLAVSDPYPSRAVQWGVSQMQMIDQPVTSFAIGPRNVAAVLEDGSVVAWGSGTTLNGRQRFAKPVRKVSISNSRAYAVLEDSTLTGWGAIAEWRWPIPDDLGKVVDVSVDENFVVALRPDGSLRAWGKDSQYVQPPAGLIGLRSIQAVGYWTMAVTEKDSVVRIGNDSVFPTEFGDAVTYRNMMVLPKSGKIEYYGYGTIDSLVGVARGRDHYLYLRSNGQVLAFGDSSDGRCDVPKSLSGRIRHIDADEGFSVALLDDGRLAAWGVDSLQRTCIPYLPERVAKMVSSGHQAIGILPDSTVATWGDYWTGPYQPPRGLNRVVDVAAGYRFVAALRVDGSIVVWGAASAVANAGVPSNTTDIVDIEAGFNSLVGIRRDGSLVFWGSVGAFDDAVRRPGLEMREMKSLSLSTKYALGVRKDGNVVVWGAGVAVDSLPKDVGKVKAVWHAADQGGFALREDNTLVGWGVASSPLFPVPSDLGPIRDLSVYHYLAVAQRMDGTLRQWGQSSYAADTLPSGLGPVSAFTIVGHPVGFKVDPTASAWPKTSSSWHPDFALRMENGSLRASSGRAGHWQILSLDGRAIGAPSFGYNLSVPLAGLPRGVALVVFRAPGQAPVSRRWVGR